LTTDAADRVGFIPYGPTLWIEAKITGNGMPHQPKSGAIPITAEDLLEALRGPLRGSTISTFSRDTAYSSSPTASRASPRSRKILIRLILPSMKS